MKEVVVYNNQGLLPVALSSNTLDLYMQQLTLIPVLSADEEYELTMRLKEKDDLDAARQLIFTHLRFVAHIARGYKGYGLPLADVIQEGNIGLMKAVKRFDPTVGVRLVSFAVHWIRAEIHEYILRNWRTVKVATTKAQRKLFFKLRSNKRRLGWLNREEVDVIADDLGVSAKDVMEMEARLSGVDVSYDLPESGDDEHVYSPAQYLAAPGQDPAEAAESSDWAEQGGQRLELALTKLDDRSRDIVASRWLADKKATLHDLAGKYQVSAERIRQLEENAIKKLRLAFSD